MRVVDLLNVLQRFPGDASVTVSDVAVGDLTVVQDGEVTHEPAKGTKGIKAEAEAEAPRRRVRRKDEAGE